MGSILTPLFSASILLAALASACGNDVPENAGVGRVAAPCELVSERQVEHATRGVVIEAMDVNEDHHVTADSGPTCSWLIEGPGGDRYRAHLDVRARRFFDTNRTDGQIPVHGLGDKAYYYDVRGDLGLRMWARLGDIAMACDVEISSFGSNRGRSERSHQACFEILDAALEALPAEE